jgi:hypothetical protein
MLVLPRNNAGGQAAAPSLRSMVLVETADARDTRQLLGEPTRRLLDDDKHEEKEFGQVLPLAVQAMRFAAPQTTAQIIYPTFDILLCSVAAKINHARRGSWTEPGRAELSEVTAEEIYIYIYIAITGLRWPFSARSIWQQ